MVYVNKSVGARGVIRCEVTQVSQDIAANTSYVKVVGYIYLTNGGPSGDQTGNCKMSFTGSASTGTLDGSFSNISYPEVRVMLTRYYTVAHAADGTKSVSYTFNFGPTITTNFGSGGSVTCSLTLTTIPRAPLKVATPTLTKVSGGTVQVVWSAPGQGGAAIDKYRIAYDSSSPLQASQIVIDPATSPATISGLLGKKTWYFQVSAHNTYGWGAWSNVASIYLDIKGPLINKDGVWGNTQAYVKHNGVWKEATAYAKNAGVWKELV